MLAPNPSQHLESQSVSQRNPSRFHQSVKRSSGKPFSQGQAKNDYQPGQKGGTTGAKYAGDFPATTGGQALAFSGEATNAPALPPTARAGGPAPQPAQSAAPDATRVGDVGALTPDALRRSAQGETPNQVVGQDFEALAPSAGAVFPPPSRGDRAAAPAQPQQQPVQPGPPQPSSGAPPARGRLVLEVPMPNAINPRTGQHFQHSRDGREEMEAAQFLDGRAMTLPPHQAQQLRVIMPRICARQ
jgi:hypothetical protein